MRVISGQFGGIRLEVMKGNNTRPTTDKIKEAIFSILTPYLDNGTALDLYAGTGGLGIEAVSRGLDHAYLVDRNAQAIKVIEKNVEKTHSAEQFTILKQNSHSALRSFVAKEIKFDLVLLDPPYAKETIKDDLSFMLENNLLNDGAIILAETDTNANLDGLEDNFELLAHKKYGITLVNVYRYNEE